jgi:SNF2 family DNA or RNA helicase
MIATRTYGKIKYDLKDDKWIIQEAEPHVCVRLKQIFPKIATYATLPYSLSNTPDISFDIEWFMQRHPLKIKEDDRQLLLQQKGRHIDFVNELEQILIPKWTKFKPIKVNGTEARPYQVQSDRFGVKVKRYLLADDVGLGKSLTSLLLPMRKGINALPAALVVQPHIIKQWKEEHIEQYFNYRVHVVKTVKAYDLPEADFYIFTYRKLSGWKEVFNTGFFKYCIFDEIQELRHDDTDKYEAAEALSKACEYAVGLSATPIYNEGKEIFNVMNILKPGCLGDEADFIREWCAGNGKTVINPMALGSYLRENFFMLRRTREEVGMQLPKVNTLFYDVECDEDEVAKSEDEAYEIAQRVVHGDFFESGEASRQFDLKLREVTGIAKARSVAAFVKSFLLDNNEPVVLYGWHRAVYDIWLEEFADYNPVMYTGSENVNAKEKSKQAYLSGDSKIIIISLRSGAGINGLQNRGKTVVYGELDWSPQVHYQNTARVDRHRKSGIEEQVTEFYLTTDWGSDPPMLNLLGLKASQSHGIIDPMLKPADQYSDPAKIKAMAKSFIEAYEKKHKIKNHNSTIS